MGVNRSFGSARKHDTVILDVILAGMVGVILGIIFKGSCTDERTKSTAVAPACAEVPACVCQCLPTVGPVGLEEQP
jgi:hypothetical protein